MSLRIAFISANSVLDPSSGAAISIRTLLRLLSAAGATTRSLTASIYDRSPLASNIENMRAVGAVPTDPDAPFADLWRATDGDVLHEIIPVPKLARLAQSKPDERRMTGFALAMIENFRPHVILTYGGGHFEKEMVALARERGIVTAFYLANPGYQNRSTFENIDQVFTDTETTRDLYVERLGLSPYAIGKFVDRPSVEELHTGSRVTFVNPTPEKGVTLFYRIAQLAAQTAPQIRFQVVESRGTLQAAEKRAGIPFSALPNIERVGLQRDMAEVFSKTKVLLQPSLWHESGARAAIEAMSLGIPILATDRGGIPEVVGDAGILITPSASLVADHWFVPPITEAVPWVEVLRELFFNEAFFAAQSQRALEGWKAHEPSGRISRMLSLLEQLVAAKQRP